MLAPGVTSYRPLCQGQVTTDPLRSPSPDIPTIDTGVLDRVDGPIDSEGRRYVAVHLYDDPLIRPHINYAGHLYEGSHCSPHSFVSTIMFSQTGF